MKIVTIVGARPQFIKAATVSRAIAQHNTSNSPSKQIQEVIVHTGQHYDKNMSDIFFDEMEIPKPTYHLDVNGCSHGEMTGLMLQKIESLLVKEKPDWLLVFGDTNSTLAGALAAVKMHIPVAHVEAGLRSFNKKMPEEINRILTDHSSTLLFTPTSAATDQLKKEAFPTAKICQVGDVMYDASLYYREKVALRACLLKKLQLDSKKYFLATLHRQENTDDPARLQSIFKGLIEVAKSRTVVIPLHPRTRGVLEKQGLLELVQRYLRVIDPVGFFEMIQLESEAELILTDSGGVQKEAFFFQVPCIVLRDETEWVELVEGGFNQLMKSDLALETQVKQLLHLQCDWKVPLYGEGNASNKIISILSNH